MTALDTRWSCAAVLPKNAGLAAARTVVVGVYDDGIGDGGLLLRDQLGIDPEALSRVSNEMHGQVGSVAMSLSGSVGPQIVVVGLGAQADHDAGRLRAASSRAARALAGVPGRVVTLLALEDSDAAAAAAVIEGHLLGAWSYERPRPDARSQESSILSVVVTDDGERGRASNERSSMIAGITNWIRQRVETPPNLLGPKEFADDVRALADELAPGLITTVVSETDVLVERGFGGTLGVGAGSDRTPRVLELISGTGVPIGLAGKGITFDAGGLNLKRSASELAWMKSDMAAAAAVAGAVIAAAALGSTRAIHAVLPIAENLTGGGAQRPGDVVTHPGGRTTEITDTDSEGRVVLADAIGWLALRGVSAIIDVGTLTDSGAVGVEYWGCWTTDPRLAADVLAAGTRAGDPGWLLPLHESYRDLIASRVADSANAPLEVPDIGQLAATYLRPFAGEIPWLHIDNGSGAWLERDTGSWPAGPTGTPVRALIEYLAPRR